MCRVLRDQDRPPEFNAGDVLSVAVDRLLRGHRLRARHRVAHRRFARYARLPRAGSRPGAARAFDHLAPRRLIDVETGDTLFTNGVGRPDLHADAEAVRRRARDLFQSLSKLRELPPNMVVLPAHASEPIPFDGRPIAAALDEVSAWLSDWIRSESAFVARVTWTLLDIGSGVGALTFGLLERGIAHAIAVDASSAYTSAARQEAERVGRAGVVQFIHADFVSVASELPGATLVTLDRVVCCYPSYEPLLDAALRHADQCLALSYPRDVWYVRLGVSVENGQRRLTKNSFRTFVHPVARMEQMVRAAGFDLSSRRETWMWSIDVYTRGRS